MTLPTSPSSTDKPKSAVRTSNPSSRTLLHSTPITQTATLTHQLTTPRAGMHVQSKTTAPPDARSHQIRTIDPTKQDVDTKLIPALPGNARTFPLKCSGTSNAAMRLYAKLCCAYFQASINNLDCRGWASEIYTPPMPFRQPATLLCMVRKRKLQTSFSRTQEMFE